MMKIPTHSAISLIALLFQASCASIGSIGNIQQHARMLVPGKTTKLQVTHSLGTPSETFLDGDREVFVYADKIDVPLAVSLIPVIGDITDGIELIHTNRELIIQFDENGIVRKFKLRDTD